MTALDRFARQRLLPLVGDEGQARLASASLALPTDLEAQAVTVAELYARAAGFAAVRADAADPKPFVHGSHFRHAAARDFASGTHIVLSAALATFRRETPK
jgi:hypothetical protein